MPPLAGVPPPKTASAFTRALEEYIDSRPGNSKTPQFIRDIQQQRQNGVRLDSNAVKQAIVQLERESSDRTATRRMRKILNPVVTVLTTYAGVIDTLCQADPMPTALIWGCLKATISASTRFLDLYDKISDQLASLNTHITILTAYEELFGESLTMQELLQSSYVDIIRFWRRVEKECKRCIANRMARAIASFSTTKLDQIISAIDQNAQRIHLLIPIVQERIDSGEREDAARERQLAGLARDEQKLFWEIQAEEMKRQNEERKYARKRDVGVWLLAGAPQVNESNHRHQEQNSQCRSPDTCTWLLNEKTFIEWIKPSFVAPMLWVKADPGIGKSVLTAFAIQEAQQRHSGIAATCFQYYTFDEEFSSLQVFRALAEQLVNVLWEQTGDTLEEVHALTQKTATSTRVDDLKMLLRQLCQQLEPTYIFLDGLDNECDHGPRWYQLKQVLDFFLQVATCENLSIKVWCSSQARTSIDDVLQLFPSLTVTPDLNSRDIQRYLERKIPELDDLEIEEDYKQLIAKDLGLRADGCFLWASLMLESITRASSLQAIKEQINEGLPLGYEAYYIEKLASIDTADRRLVSYVQYGSDDGLS